jgi:hypothetical protein
MEKLAPELYFYDKHFSTPVKSFNCFISGEIVSGQHANARNAAQCSAAPVRKGGCVAISLVIASVSEGTRFRPLPFIRPEPATFHALPFTVHGFRQRFITSVSWTVDGER